MLAPLDPDDAGVPAASSFERLPELPDELASCVVPLEVPLPPHPELLTETHADPVAETVPTGVSAPAETEAFVCEETGAGAETFAVSVAAVFVSPCITPPIKTPPLPMTPISWEGSLDSPIAADVPAVAVAEVAVSCAVPATTPAPVDAELVVEVVVPVTAAMVDEAVFSTTPPRLSEEAGADVVGVAPEQPGSLTETQADPVAETSPTGVSVPAEVDAVVCEETGTTGAETSAVSVAAVFVPVVVRLV